MAEVLRRHWPAYERKFRARLWPSHRRAVTAILSCRTPALGGQLFRCECGRRHFAYHSCNHRACPQCGQADATEWLARQRQRLLPVPYYLVTFTVPSELRALIRCRQKDFYPLLVRESATALQDVARDHKDLGAELGLLAVLQTWTRDLRFHPHVHCVVPGGGLSADGLRWVRPKKPDYFLPQQVLALRFRTRLKQALQKNHPQFFAQIPRRVWFRAWVADVQPVGRGEPALKYLSAYVYRTAFSAERIIAENGQHITFTYRDRATRRTRTLRLPVEQFIHRFLQHVLPKGLQRVRWPLRRVVWLARARRQKTLRAHPRFARSSSAPARRARAFASARMSLLQKADDPCRTLAAPAIARWLWKPAAVEQDAALAKPTRVRRASLSARALSPAKTHQALPQSSFSIMLQPRKKPRPASSQESEGFLKSQHSRRVKKQKTSN